MLRHDRVQSKWSGAPSSEFGATDGLFLELFGASDLIPGSMRRGNNVGKHIAAVLPARRANTRASSASCFTIIEQWFAPLERALGFADQFDYLLRRCVLGRIRSDVTK
jgi:hypothetical protein